MSDTIKDMRFRDPVNIQTTSEIQGKNEIFHFCGYVIIYLSFFIY